ncbi:MAG: flippase-like domain-containing protein [Bacteroidia bacterium]|nr:flippase-like domain-containing protein [Bacteroidia bacterium]
MIGGLPYKTKQFFFVLIKLSIVIGAFYFIYIKLTTNEELYFSNFIDFLSKNDVFSSKNIIFLLFLTIFNWFLEILKWQNLVSFVKKISFKEALEQSLGALTASLFTPNRIGEYGAKAVYFAKQFRNRVLLLNLLGNSFQMLVTSLFGVIGFIIFSSRYDIQISFFKLSRLLIVAAFILAIVIIGFKEDKFHIKGFSIQRIKDYIKDVSLKIHTLNFAYSLVRYLIFSFQFYFLLSIFGVNMSYMDAMIIITSMYLLASIIPSIFVFDVIIKGSVAVYLFSFVHVNELTILCIITLMWLLNFVLPSIFGSYYVLNFNWYNSEDE